MVFLYGSFRATMSAMLRLFTDGQQRRHRCGNREAHPSTGALLASALWKSEDARMGIFDAVALALTFFSTVDQKG